LEWSLKEDTLLDVAGGDVEQTILVADAWYGPGLVRFFRTGFGLYQVKVLVLRGTMSSRPAADRVCGDAGGLKSSRYAIYWRGGQCLAPKEDSIARGLGCVQESCYILDYMVPDCQESPEFPPDCPADASPPGCVGAGRRPWSRSMSTKDVRAPGVIPGGELACEYLARGILSVECMRMRV
jgi:hypothetical protein